MIGSSLDPLKGRYLQEIPKDPWDRDYLIDCDMGLILTFGEDGMAGGVGMDEDTCLRYKPLLTIKRVQYDMNYNSSDQRSGWGIPVKENEVIITMCRPFEVINADKIEETLNLLTDLRSQDVALPRKGSPVSFSEMNTMGVQPPHWNSNSSKSKYHNPRNGVLSLLNEVTAAGEGVQQIHPTMGINFDLTVPTTPLGAEYGIVETSVPEGPLNPLHYGPGVMGYYKAPAYVPLYEGENRGIKIERF